MATFTADNTAFQIPDAGQLFVAGSNSGANYDSGSIYMRSGNDLNRFDLRNLVKTVSGTEYLASNPNAATNMINGNNPFVAGKSYFADTGEEVTSAGLILQRAAEIFKQQTGIDYFKLQGQNLGDAFTGQDAGGGAVKGINTIQDLQNLMQNFQPGGNVDVRGNTGGVSTTQTYTTPSGQVVTAPSPQAAPPPSGTLPAGTQMYPAQQGNIQTGPTNDPSGIPPGMNLNPNSPNASLPVQGVQNVQGAAPTGVQFGPNGYSGISIVDYLNAAGQPSDKASRVRLAQQFGVQNYDYSAAKNTELLEKLRAGGGASSTGSAATAPSVDPAVTTTGQTGTPQVPTTSNGKTPYENVMETYSKTYEQLGLGSIKTAYEKIINDQKALQDKLNDEVANINDNPWLSEGIRVKQIERAQGRYETRLNTLSNYAKLYDSLYQEGRQTAQFLVGQVQTDTRFAIEQAQKKQDALDKLTNQDHEFVEANGRKYLVDKKTGTIIADIGAATKTGGTGTGNNQVTDNERALLGQFQQSPIVKNYNEIVSQKLTLDNIIKNGVGGPADLAVVYSFMKSLDPNSVVRETEYAIAAKSGNIFAGQFAKFNGYFKEEGGFLPPQVKTEFQNLTNQRLSAQQASYDNYAEQYRGIAERQGLNPANVVPNFGGALTGGSTGASKQAPGTIVTNNNIMYQVGSDGETLTAIGSAL